MSQTIGRYEIERELGEGGMATVYFARDPVMDRKVVVKVILSEYSRDLQFRARFNREAKIITALEHDAIVPVYDFGDHDGQPYIVMRHMPGGSLQDRVPYTQLSLPEIAHIIDRVADALDYVHSKGVIHRDLKPGNILFDDRGKAYLSDFGIAKLTEASTQLTGTGIIGTIGIIGTPGYMSPEQARAMQDLDWRSDVYSLGVIIFQLLTGELPYHARDAMGMALAHVNEPVPDIRKTRPDLPRESDSLIRRAMAKKPGDRYQTTSELAVELSKMATKPSALPKPSPRVIPFKPPSPPKPTVPDGDPLPPSGPAGPQFGKLLYIVPAILLSVCVLATLLAGIAFIPGLLAGPTAQATRAAVITAATSFTTLAPTPTETPPSPTATRTRSPSTPTPIPTQTLKPSANPALGIGSTQNSEKDGMVLLYVPEGEFTMGSAVGDSDEGPVHTVRLDAFWIDKTEVTNAMYKLCVDAGICQPPDNPGSSTHNSYYSNSTYDKYPVIYVSWNDATAYCEWAGRRLPTEAEWEKAARGTDEWQFPWGDSPPDANLLNFNNNLGDTAEVGQYPNGASPYGALDMAGNVWEWVSSIYIAYPYDAGDGREDPNSTGSRVVRGGSWEVPHDVVRAAYRVRDEPTFTVNVTGFRCALSP